MAGMTGDRVYVGNLNPRATERDLHDFFDGFGRINKLWVARKPPGFAFVEFDDSAQAEAAVRALDGVAMLGRTVRVEFRQSQNEGRAPRGTSRGMPRDGGRDGGRDRDGGYDDRGGGAARRGRGEGPRTGAGPRPRIRRPRPRARRPRPRVRRPRPRARREAGRGREGPRPEPEAWRGRALPDHGGGHPGSHERADDRDALCQVRRAGAVRAGQEPPRGGYRGVRLARRHGARAGNAGPRGD